MTSASIATIQDRIYAINQTIANVNARRTWPQALATAMMPLLVSLPGEGSRDTMDITNVQWHITRTFDLHAVIGTIMGGLPTESGQLATEALVEAIEDAYCSRGRLQLSGDILTGLKRAALGSDSGIVADENLGVFRITFPLVVVYDRAIAQAT